jgi:hypothetical protein
LLIVCICGVNVESSLCVEGTNVLAFQNRIDYIVSPVLHSLKAFPIICAQSEEVIYVASVIKHGVRVRKTNWHHRRLSLQHTEARVKCPLLVSNFDEIGMCWQWKSPVKNLIKISSLVLELLHASRCMYEGESIKKVNLSIESTQQFWPLAVSDNIANFVRNLTSTTYSDMQYWVHEYIMDTYVCEKCKFTLFVDSPMYLLNVIVMFSNSSYECV